MTKLTDFIQLKTVQGTAVSTPQHTLIPESQALVVKFPFGGFVWQRPTAVLVQSGTKTERHPIVDVTRLATVSVMVVSLFIPLLIRLVKKQTT